MSPETHFLGKVAQKAIIEKDGKVLIVRNTHDTAWELPGGRLNVDELPLEGLKREVKEEIGVDIIVHEVVYGEQFLHPHMSDRHVFFMYHATLVDPEQDFVLQEGEVSEVQWIGKDELDAQEIFPLYRKALEVFFR